MDGTDKQMHNKANIPVVYSDFLEIPLNDKQRKSIQHLTTTGCSHIDLDYKAENVDMLLFQSAVFTIQRLLAIKEDTKDFALDVLKRNIGLKHGRDNIGQKAVDEISSRLNDPHQWDVVFFAAWGSGIASDPVKSFHRDGLKVGELRLSFSREKSTTFRVGPHIATNSTTTPEPVKDPNGIDLTREVTPDPGTLVMWDAQRSIHRSPSLSKSELKSFGGTRNFATLSIGFNKVTDQIFER